MHIFGIFPSNRAKEGRIMVNNHPVITFTNWPVRSQTEIMSRAEFRNFLTKTRVASPVFETEYEMCLARVLVVTA